MAICDKKISLVNLYLIYFIQFEAKMGTIFANLQQEDFGSGWIHFHHSNFPNIHSK